MELLASRVESRGHLRCVGLLCVPSCSRLSVSRVSQYSTLHRCAPPPHRSRPAVFPLSFSEVAFNSFRSPLQQVFPSEYFMSVYLEVTAWSFALSLLPIRLNSSRPRS